MVSFITKLKLKLENMSPQNMLELQQMVLLNVYENTFLFEKEIRKSLVWLNGSELSKLYEWIIENFNEKYIQIADKVFGKSFKSLQSYN